MNVIPVWSTPGATWGQDRYNQIGARGFDAVRFVLYWDDFEPSRGAWNSTSLATLDTAVSRAKAAGLYVVLDMIHLWGPGGFNDVPAWAINGDSMSTVVTNGTGYLALLAARYAPEPAVAGYDLVNEPHRWPINQASVIRDYDALIAAVRPAAPDKIVLIEPAYGDTFVAASDFGGLTHRSNVVWSLHDYFAGGDADGYNADGSQAGRYTWDGVTGYSPPDFAALERHFRVHVLATAEAGLPIWVGEFGIGDGVVGHDQWIADQVSVFKSSAGGYAWWEYFTTGPLSATNGDFTWKPWVGLLLA